MKWPDSVGFNSRTIQEIDDDMEAHVSAIEMDVHCGTHIDAPMHFLKDGAALESIPLSKLIGPCYVFDCGDAKVIDSDLVSRLPLDVKKVLFKTTNSDIWRSNSVDFVDRYVALNASGAAALAARDLDLVGVDYLSIQGFYEHNDTHRILLMTEVVLLETINLNGIAEGYYDLYCLPLKIKGLEAAPCRAILKENE